MSENPPEKRPAEDQSEPLGRQLGARLRAIRKQKKLSLQDLEQQSGGQWKAAIVSAYERGDRSISAVKLAELAEFYDVPLSAIFPGRGSGVAETSRYCRIDVNALKAAPESLVGGLQRFVASIQQMRGDYNGQVITLRDSDLQLFASLHRVDIPVLLRIWGQAGILFRPSHID